MLRLRQADSVGHPRFGFHHGEHPLRRFCTGNVKLIRYGLLYDGRGREGQRSLVGLVDAASLVKPAQVAPTTDNLSG